MNSNKTQNFLLTNDDGIEAPGLKALILLMQKFGNLYTVAPIETLSGCGHQVSGKVLLKAKELKTTNAKELKRWAVQGTPADCVRLALKVLLKNLKIDYVFSGINAGGNLGVDVYTSGTIAAARESAFWRIPGIALSHHIKGREIDWNLAVERSFKVVQSVINRGNDPQVYWNINLPHINSNEIDIDFLDCHVDNNPAHVVFEEKDKLTFANRGNYNMRPKTPGSDISTCFDGKISVSRLTI